MKYNNECQGSAQMAAYLKESSGETLAAVVYAGSFLVMSIVFSGMNHHILLRRSQYFTTEIEESLRRRALRRGIVGLIPYFAPAHRLPAEDALNHVVTMAAKSG